MSGVRVPLRPLSDAVALTQALTCGQPTAQGNFPSSSGTHERVARLVGRHRISEPASAMSVVTRAEVYTLMSRHLRPLASLGFAVCFLSSVPSVVAAQSSRAPDPNATRVMVDNFRTPGMEKGLSVQAADAVRSRMRTDFPFKQVYVLQRDELTAILQASGFPTNEPLAPHDAKLLATQLRADEYIQGTASKTPTGFRLEPVLILTRDNSLIQPLGVHEGNNLTNAATSASKELKEARKQMDGERQCVQFAREQKYAEAKEAARAGITAYPKATIARVCLASVLVAEKAAPESLMTVAREIINIYPNSKPGLQFLAQSYQDLKMSDSMIVTLTRLLQTDPQDAAMVSRIIEVIAAEANPGIAKPIIDSAVALNPSDPELLRLQWRILYATRNYTEMLTAGEELIKLDTANADTTYFITSTIAMQRDSQPQKAAEFAARGVAKFPSSGTLVGLQLGALRAAGQSQQAIEVLDRATQGGVDVANASAIRLQLLRDLGRTEEILPAARALIAGGDTTSAVRAIVINAANEQRSKAAEAKSIDDFRTALQTARYADSVAIGDQKVQSSFILGAVYAQLGPMILFQANESRSCEQTKEANDMLVEAQILLPRGGAFAPDAMRALMNNTMAMSQNADQMLKAFCK